MLDPATLGSIAGALKGLSGGSTKVNVAQSSNNTSLTNLALSLTSAFGGGASGGGNPPTFNTPITSVPSAGINATPDYISEPYGVIPYEEVGPIASGGGKKSAGDDSIIIWALGAVAVFIVFSLLKKKGG